MRLSVMKSNQKTQKEKLQNVAKNILKDLDYGERIKQNVIKRWIRFGTIGDRLPRCKARCEEVINDEVDQSSSNVNILTGILEDTKKILNDFDFDILREKGDLAVDDCFNKNANQDMEMEVDFCKIESNNVGEGNVKENRERSELRKDEAFGSDMLIDNMLEEDGALQPGGIVDIAAGEFCRVLENDGNLGVSDGSDDGGVLYMGENSELDGAELKNVSGGTEDVQKDKEVFLEERTREVVVGVGLIKKKNHEVREACKCKKKCINKVKEERRMKINEGFWKLSFNDRRKWIYSHVKQVSKKRCMTGDGKESRRAYSRYYFMPLIDGNEVSVCKTFFLNTLGYSCDSVITETLKSSDPERIYPQNDKRGCHAPPHKLKDEVIAMIRAHIMSFHPQISHYRRVHAPNRLYLPTDVNATEMFADFNTKFPNLLAYDTYRKQIKQMNIAFVKLGEEDCEVCEEYNLHMKTPHVETLQEDCEKCLEFEVHKKRYVEARKSYKHDAESSAENTKYLSVDLQKVILLPRLPGYKAAIFTARLITFNQTFAPLGGKKMSKSRPLGVIWYAAVSGRKAADITSTYAKVLEHSYYRDSKHITFWCDNCTAQNKNWTLFPFLVAHVNSPGQIETITLKYFEPGHTFMSADAYHHLVEKEFKKRKNIFDFQDFVDVINTNGEAIIMKCNDFKLFTKDVSEGKYTNKPLLQDVCEIQFRRGSVEMYWKCPTKKPYTNLAYF